MLIQNLHLNIIKHFFLDVSGKNLKIGTPIKDKIIFSKNIEFYTNLEEISGPEVFLDKKLIRLDERFLSILWATSYYHYVINESIYDNDLFEEKSSSLNLDKPILKKASELFEWALSQVNSFSVWPISLPNPFYYNICDSREEGYITQVNYMYCKAVSFLLFHEYGHIILSHKDFYKEYQETNFLQMTKEEIYTADLQIKELEKDADNYAYAMLLSDTKDNFNNLMGVCFAIMVLLFYSKKKELSRHSHPDLDQRIINAMTFYKLKQDKSDYIWQILNIGLNKYFSFKNIDLNRDLDSHISAEKLFTFLLAKFDQIK